MSTTTLRHVDPEIHHLIQMETKRQEEGLELIASENYTDLAVMEAQGSVLTNKYAEGYPQKRYYGGCEFVDEVEQLAIQRVCQLFGASYANVQPHSGSQANMAVYFTVLNPGDKLMGMELGHGGHLTHGGPMNFSGKIYQSCFYGIDPQTEQLNYNTILEQAKKERPKVMVAGASAYPRTIDFAAMKDIAQSVGALLMVDMAHIAGLVAAKLHPTPVGVADFVTSTTHKTLRGPRGGFILSGGEWEKKLNSTVFPGIQGGPLEHVIAAKAVAFRQALDPSFTTYQRQVLANAKTLASTLLEEGLELVSGGTDNHLLLVKTDSVGLSGKEAEGILERSGLTCNKNMIPNDQRSPFVTSGIRLGTPAMTTRGLKEEHMRWLGQGIAQLLKNPQSEDLRNKISLEVRELCGQFPVYP